jgi:hypothetical protein
MWNIKDYWPHLKLLFINEIPAFPEIEDVPTLKNVKILPTINLWQALHERNLDLLRRGLEIYKKKEYQPEEEFYFQSFFCTDEKVFWRTTPLIYSCRKELIDFFLDEVKVPIDQRADQKMGEYNEGRYLSYRTPKEYKTTPKDSALEQNYDNAKLFSYLASRGAKFNDKLISLCLKENKHGT